jgi:hypothetical protein
MKSVIIKLFVTLIFAGVLFIGCSDNLGSEPLANSDSNYSQGLDFFIDINSLPYEDLSDAEKEGLVFMREEEKLARDVYKNMFHKYSLKIFNNISASEQTHMNAIKQILDKYGVSDPVENDLTGTFLNQELQTIYNVLVLKGSESVIEALNVGAIIEEVDIIDLQKELNSPEVDNEDIKFVYNNLLKGSANHLRAFVKNLKVRGVSYSPQYLDPETFTKIINGQI